MASANLVIDTSVFIKWYRQGEVLADRALILREAYLDGRLVILAPSLCLYEFANVLCYKDDLTTEQVQSAVQSMFDIGIEWISPSREVLAGAVDIARSYQVTIYDAVFVALAAILDVNFVTADKRLTDRLAVLPTVQYLGEGGSEFFESP
jgi:predicted nucleic acid-binding protein